MDYSLPGSSVHGIFQARVLESGAIAFSVKLLSKCLIHLATDTVIIVIFPEAELQLAPYNFHTLGLALSLEILPSPTLPAAYSCISQSSLSPDTRYIYIYFFFFCKLRYSLH